MQLFKDKADKDRYLTILFDMRLIKQDSGISQIFIAINQGGYSRKPGHMGECSEIIDIFLDLRVIKLFDCLFFKLPYPAITKL